MSIAPFLFSSRDHFSFVNPSGNSQVFLLVLTGALGHALRGKTAGAFGPDLAKKLAQLVKMEKNVMRSLELVAKERMEVAVSFALETPARESG